MTTHLDSHDYVAAALDRCGSDRNIPDDVKVKIRAELYRLINAQSSPLTAIPPEGVISSLEKEVKKLRSDRVLLWSALDDMVSSFEPHAWGSNDNKKDALSNAREALKL